MFVERDVSKGNKGNSSARERERKKNKNSSVSKEREKKKIQGNREKDTKR